MASKLLKEFADKLPTTLPELAAISPNFRRSRTDVTTILSICQKALIRVDAAYKRGLPDAQTLCLTSSEEDSEIDSSTDEEPLLG